MGLMSYLLTPASKHKLTNPDEVHKAIKVLQVARASRLNGIPNRVLHLLRSERHPSASGFLTRFSEHTTFQQRERKDE